MSLLIAENSRSSFTILLPGEEERCLTFAAKELAKYLSAISGAEFPIIRGNIPPSPSSPLFILEAEKELPDQLDAYSYKVESGSLHFKGVNPRSTLYGVYDFLEELGCSFAEPGIETVPKLPTLIYKGNGRSSKSTFILRNIFREQIQLQKAKPFYGLEKDHIPQIDFMAKRRCNHYDFYVDYCRFDLWEKHKHNVLDALLDRGFKLEVCHHSIGYFFPSEAAKDYGDFGPSTYYANHPEWYLKNQARIEIPEVAEIITDRYLAYVERNPELKMIGVWPGDSGMPPPAEGMNVADGYLIFWNNISKRLAEKFPDKYLSTIAYFDLWDPPKVMRGAENQMLWFCPIRSNYHYSMTDHPANAAYLKQMEGWIGKMPPGRVNVFDYFGWQPILIPYARNMQKSLRTYRDLGAAGAYGWVGFTLNLMGVEYRWARDLYSYCNLLWDPDHDVEKDKEVWAKGVFGSASDAIVDFYDCLQEEHDKILLTCKPAAMKPWITIPLLHKLQEILAKARGSAESNAVLKRVDLLEQLAANGSAAKIIEESEEKSRHDPLNRL